MSDSTNSNSTTAKAKAASQDAAASVRDAGEQARRVGAQVAATASDLATDAKQRGAAVVEDVKDKLTAGAESQKSGVADKLEDVAQAVHRSGEQLEGHQDWVAGLIERGADELGSLATTLRGNDLNGLLGNLQNLARRQPAMFAGLSIAAGFAAMRLGKLAVAGASSDDLPTLPEKAGE